MLCKSLQTFVKQHPFLTSFLIIFPIMLFINLSHPHPFVFYYDSGQYWEFSRYFVKDGAFSLLSFDNPLRGYLFPFLLFSIRKMAFWIGVADYVFYEVVMSLVYTTFLVIIIPLLVQKLITIKVNFLQIVGFSLLTIFFWKGSFFYPLSDLFAFISMIMGVFLIVKFKGRWWQLLFAGLFWGGAALIRPIYAVTLPFLVLWSLYFYKREDPLVRWQSTAGRLIALIVGLTTVLAPQFAINKINFGVSTPFVLTKVDGPSLFVQQLNWGIKIQKYETNIGKTYPSASVYFFDKQGENILLKSESQPVTLRDYIILVVNYPLDFLTMYARHLFNGLDVVYNSTYVENVYENGLVIRLLNYSLWFLIINSIGYIHKVKARNILDHKFLFLGISCLPSIMSIPTAIEVRFMLPIQIMAYALVSFWILPKYFSKSKERKAQILRELVLPYITFIVFCFILSANTYAGLQYGPYILTGN